MTLMEDDESGDKPLPGFGIIPATPPDPGPEPIQNFSMDRVPMYEARTRKGLAIALGVGWVVVLVAQIVLSLTLTPEAWVKVGVALGAAGQTVGTFLGLVVGYYFRRD